MAKDSSHVGRLAMAPCDDDCDSATIARHHANSAMNMNATLPHDQRRPRRHARSVKHFEACAAPTPARAHAAAAMAQAGQLPSEMGDLLASVKVSTKPRVKRPRAPFQEPLTVGKNDDQAPAVPQTVLAGFFANAERAHVNMLRDARKLVENLRLAHESMLQETSKLVDNLELYLSHVTSIKKNLKRPDDAGDDHDDDGGEVVP